jgi:hypothetical protein
MPKLNQQKCGESGKSRDESGKYSTPKMIRNFFAGMVFILK